MLEEAEKSCKEHNTLQVYQKINAIKRGYKKYKIVLKNNSRTLITIQLDIIDKCRYIMNSFIIMN